MENSAASFYYGSWKHAEILGELEDAAYWKERYRVAVMRKIVKRYHQYNEALKQFPLINLN